MAWKVKDFGEKYGQQIRLFTLRNAAGNEASVSTLGATLTRWTALDKAEKQASVVLGFQNPERYLEAQLPYFNPVIGRYANRIAGGKFPIGDTVFQLSQNEGSNHLHGGFSGFDKKIWEAAPAGNALELHYTSPADEEGYPGRLKATVCYELDEDNTLHIRYRATTDAPTVVNLTLHGWFNLSGIAGSTVLDHWLRIAADRYTPAGKDLIPTGALLPVENTPFDFRDFCKPEDKIVQKPEGYDQNFVLNMPAGKNEPAAEVYHPASGRLLQIFTDQPGMQLYTGQGLDGSLQTDSGVLIPKWGGLVLEPQRFPDTPNQPLFGNAVLVPGQVYEHHSCYRCSVQKEAPPNFARHATID